MKSRIFLLSLSALSLLALTGCSQEKAMTEADMAKKYGMSLEEYEQSKENAAAMNMTIEQHMAEGHDMTK